ncbi:MAG: FxsA family protein [Acidimicrobiales bacterium]
MLFLGLLLFAAAEIAAFVVVAFQIGFLWAVVAIVAASALGPFVLWRVGLGVLGRARERLARGEVPTRDLLDGVVVLIGGCLLCVPGFLGDAAGLLLMVGPVRHFAIRVAGHRLARHVKTFGAGRWSFVSTTARPSGEGPSVPSSAPQVGPGGRARD